MNWGYRTCVVAACTLMLAHGAAAQDNHSDDPKGDTIYLQARNSNTDLTFKL